MPPEPDPDLLARVLGTAPDPRDAQAAAEARAIGDALGRVALPAAALPGWQSLCSAEYADAVRALQRAIALARSALSVAERGR